MIKIEKIDSNNVWKVCNLSVGKHQEDFVATNSQSIIEAYTTIIDNKVALPYAIKIDDTFIGFFMLGYDSLDEGDPQIAAGNYCLWRFMIDEKFQGKGYGKQAMHAIIDLLKSGPVQKAEACWLSYEPENEGARHLYSQFGFVETGEICSDEIVAVKYLD